MRRSDTLHPPYRLRQSPMVLITFLAMLMSTALGQPANPSNGAENLPRPFPATVPPALADALASRFSQFAEVIRGSSESEKTKTRFASLGALMAVLTEAISLAPADADLRRRRIGVGESLGDHDLVQGDRQFLLRMEPGDLLTQWQVINDRIGELQTVEERLMVFERFLGPSGAAFDATVRSRLAHAAGLFALEQGEQQQFKKRMKLATDLDPSNLEAIRLRLEILSQQATGAAIQETARLLVAWCKADPADPMAPFELGGFLRANGAYASARFALEQLEILAGIRGELINDEVAGALALTIAVEMGPLRGYEFIEGYVQRRSQLEQANWLKAWQDYEKVVNAVAEVEPDQRAGTAVEILEPALPLERIADHIATMPRGLTLLRVVFAELAGLDDALVQDHFATLALQFNQAENAWRDIEEDHTLPTKTTNSARQRRLEIRVERLWLRLWLAAQPARHDTLFGRSVEAEFDELLAQDILRPEARQRFEGWIKLRAGDLENARLLLEPQAARDWPSALGLATIGHLQGPTENTARQYTELWQARPGSLLGIWAGRQAAQIRKRPLPRSALAHQLSAIVDTDLNAVRLLLLQPQDRLQLMIKAGSPGRDPQHSSKLRSLQFTLTLTNTTELPLSVRPGSFLDSQIIFEFSIQSPNSADDADDLKWIRIPGPALVRSLQIFTLPPQAQTELIVRFERTALAMILRDFTADEMTVAVRARLGTGMIFQAPERPRAVNYSAITTFRLPRLLPPNDAEPFALSLADGMVFIESINYLRSAVLQKSRPDPASEAATLRHALINKLSQAWSNLSDEGRAYALLTLPAASKSNVPEALAIFEDQARESLGEISTLAWILTRVQTLDDPIWRMAIDSEVASHRAAARFVRALGE